jgi:hypothetical protein
MRALLTRIAMHAPSCLHARSHDTAAPRTHAMAARRDLRNIVRSLAAEARPSQQAQALNTIMGEGPPGVPSGKGMGGATGARAAGVVGPAPAHTS